MRTSFDDESLSLFGWFGFGFTVGFAVVVVVVVLLLYGEDFVFVGEAIRLVVDVNKSSC